MSLTEIEEVLIRETGLDSDSIGQKNVEAAVRTRMTALGIGQLGIYAREIRKSSAERSALIDEVSVPETWFFRDPGAFDLLTLEARKRRGDATGPPLRILSAGCATGEEPYTIAMSLLDGGFFPGSFEVVAFDVSGRCVAHAAEGTYSPKPFRGRQPDLHHVVERSSQRFEIGPAVKGMVRFFRGNLLDPLLLATDPGFDFVFCRNVLIYIVRALRSKGLSNLSRLLRPGGLLFAGPSESLPGMDDRFRPYGPGAAFAFTLERSAR